MDFNLLSEEGKKPWCNIVANSYKITGDGSFGSNGTTINVVGVVEIPAFGGYQPDPPPPIAAGSLVVGSTFVVNFNGVVASTAGDDLELNFKLGGVTIWEAVVNIVYPNLPPLSPIDIDLQFRISAVGIAGAVSTFGSVTYGGIGANVAVTRQVRSSNQAVNTTIDNVPSLTASWSTADAQNSLQLSGGYMRRVI